MSDYFRFLKSNASILYFGFLSVFFGNFGQSFYITWYSAEIQQTFSLSATYYGAIYSLATLASGSCVMLLGSYIDKASFRNYSLFVAIGLIAACLVMANTLGPCSLLLGFFLVRLFGQGLLPHTGITAMAKTFDKNRGKAISAATMGIPLGEVVLPLCAVFLIAAIGWQHSWYVIAAAVLGFYIPTALFSLGCHTPVLLESSMENSRPRDEVDQDRRFALRDKRFWMLLPALLFAAFLITGVLIHQGYFLEQQAWSVEWFAICFIVYGLVHAATSLVTGWLIDRYTALNLVVFVAMPLAIAMLCLLLFSGAWTALLMLSCFAISIGMGGPVGSALWAELYGPTHLGAIRSLVTSFAVWMSALSPVIFGAFIDSGMPFEWLIFAILVLLLLAIMLAWRGASKSLQSN